MTDTTEQPYDEPHRPVQASPEVLADLWERVDDMDTRDLTAYALNLGLTPPAEPAGYHGWQLGIGYPDRDYNNPTLYWIGPQEQHSDEP